jgi:D-alanyl-D-alanine carboxypeptidase (penicillin-binding protein 5/6)
LKKIFAAFVLVFSFFVSAYAEEIPDVNCESYILIDSKTGDVLCEKSANERMMPASTTKIMTAILTLESLKDDSGLGEKITVSRSTLDNMSKDIYISRMDLKPDEVISVGDLLSCLMIASANDAANVLAEHIAGDIPNFVDMMNARAKELGAENTNFVNPDGFPAENHYATAYDLAIISRFAMTLPKFREIVATPSIKVPPTNVTPTERYYINSNNLISIHLRRTIIPP